MIGNHILNIIEIKRALQQLSISEESIARAKEELMTSKRLQFARLRKMCDHYVYCSKRAQMRHICSNKDNKWFDKDAKPCKNHYCPLIKL